jgi:hypothetical protein
MAATSVMFAAASLSAWSLFVGASTVRCAVGVAGLVGYGCHALNAWAVAATDPADAAVAAAVLWAGAVALAGGLRAAWNAQLGLDPVVATESCSDEENYLDDDDDDGGDGGALDARPAWMAAACAAQLSYSPECCPAPAA